MTALRAVRLDRMAEPCGSLWLELNGTECALRCSGALWLPNERALVVADLHLEKGSAYAMRGQLLPPYDTTDALARLEAEATALQPRIVVLLGDSFHDARALGRLAPDHAAHLGELARGRTLIWAEGNHDAILLNGAATILPGEIADEVAIASLILRHEPRPGPAPGEVAGHLHPCAKIVRGGARVRRRAFVTDGARLVLPAFGAYVGGLNIRDPAFSLLFPHPPLAAALGERRVYPLLWKSLSGGA
jgi:DNA ligase-associated metallophosphoesterase